MWELSYEAHLSNLLLRLVWVNGLHKGSFIFAVHIYSNFDRKLMGIRRREGVLQIKN
jgi:hypothetical protein